MEWFQLTGLSGILVPFAIIPGGYVFVAVTVMGNNEVTTMMDGAPMYPSKSIIQNAANSKDYITLAATVRAGGLVDIPSGAGPFTISIPTSEAFTTLLAGTVDKPLKPESKLTLVKVLVYHVVPGRLTTQDLTKVVAGGGGKAVPKIVEDDPPAVMREGNHLTATNDKGGVAMVTTGNVYQPNGVIHVVDKVLIS